jgi:diketogulonate reductase-like aldo/keto reductase
MREDLVVDFVDVSLQKLELEYIDLYLVHNPMGLTFHSMDNFFPEKDGKPDVDHTTDLLAVWRGMEAELKKGRVRAIGVSNFNSEQIKLICNYGRIKPFNIQVTYIVQVRCYYISVQRSTRARYEIASGFHACPLPGCYLSCEVVISIKLLHSLC